MPSGPMISVRNQPLHAMLILLVVMVALWELIDLSKLELGQMKSLIVLGVPIVGLMLAYALESEKAVNE